jgi:hypothetical protein
LERDLPAVETPALEVDLCSQGNSKRLADRDVESANHADEVYRGVPRRWHFTSKNGERVR